MPGQRPRPDVEEEEQIDKNFPKLQDSFDGKE